MHISIIIIPDEGEKYKMPAMSIFDLLERKSLTAKSPRR
jgi:hypothetical protein